MNDLATGINMKTAPVKLLAAIATGEVRLQVNHRLGGADESVSSAAFETLKDREMSGSATPGNRMGS